jgi:glycerol-1-phosphate dehydrogenase [NAD(P)+]
MASYLTSCLQGKGSDRVAGVLQRAGFFDEIRKDPFVKGEWRDAVRRAPALKENFYTVLSSRDCTVEIGRLIDHDEVLSGCFVE